MQNQQPACRAQSAHLEGFMRRLANCMQMGGECEVCLSERIFPQLALIVLQAERARSPAAQREMQVR